MPKWIGTIKQNIFLQIVVGLFCFAIFSESSVAASFTVNYSGRLTRYDGSPLEGPVAIQVKFWNSSTDGTQIGQTIEYSGINLSAGVFALDLVFSAPQVAAIFDDRSSPVYIEITSQNITYPRQQFSYVPFALRVPIDSKTLVFDEDGKLSLSLKTNPETNQFLTKDSDGKLTWGTPATGTIQNQTIATGNPSSGQVLTYNGLQWTASNSSSGNGSGSSVNLTAGVIGRLAVTSGGTGASSFTNNGVLIGAGNLPISTATGIQYQVLTVGAGGTLGFGTVDLAQSAAVSGVLPTSKGGTGTESTAIFPTSGVLVTRDKTETLTNKTITTATINGDSTIGGSTVINTVGSLASGAATISEYVKVKGDGVTASKLILNDSENSNFVALKAPNTLLSSVTWELPSTDGSSGQVLATNGSGTLSWASGLAPTGAAGGDLTGAFPNPTLSSVVTAGTYSRVEVDSKGRVIAGRNLDAADIPDLSASQISSGTLNSAQLPQVGSVGTYVKVTTDAYGRISDGTTLSASDLPPHSASLITSGTLDSAQLPTIGTAGTFAKVTTDSYGRVSAGTTLESSDVTSSLGFTPLNKAGDTMTGSLNLGSNDVFSAGNIQMAASKTFALSANADDPTGLSGDDKGKTWFNTATKQIKYWDGDSTQVVGAVGSAVTSLNNQTGTTQTFAVPGTSGTAPAWSSAANAHTLNIPLASTASVAAGLISNADYNTFNAKVAGVTSGTGVSVSTTGNISTVALDTTGTSGTYAKVTTDAYGRVSAGTTLSATDIPPIPASLITSGTLNTAQLPTIGTAGTFAKVATDSYGRVSAGTTLESSDVTSSLGFTPLNKAGDTMTGSLNLGSNDVLGAGNIQMAASKTLSLSGNSVDPTGLVTTDKGKTWFNTATKQIKYWDGDSTQVVGAVGSAVTSLNNQTGTTQTLSVPGTSGTAPAWSSAANAHTLNIPLASTASVTAGLISNSDYNTFNGKVTSVASGTGVSVSTIGNVATVNLATVGTAGAYAKVTTDAYGRVSAATTLLASDLPPHSASLITSGTLNTAQLPTIGTAGTYAKVTTDVYGRVSAGTTLASSDVTSSLGFTPLNKAGDTMTGSLNLSSNGLIAGTNQLVLANGNVGIGTTTPSAILHTIASSYGLPSTTGTATPNVASRLGSYQSNIVLDAGVTGLSANGAWLQVSNHTSLANTFPLLINPNGGNVGIGTTNPAGKLDVAGSICLSGANCISSWPVGSVTSVAAGTGLTGGVITSSGTLSLANTSVTAGAYTRANMTVDGQGRLTAASNGANLSLSTEVSGTLPIANGGTGATTPANAFDALSPLTTLGDLLYEGAAGAASRLAGNTTTTKQFLTSTGASGVATAPAWGTLTASDIPALSAGIITSGTLSVANGGTGASTLATNNVLLGNGTSALQAVAPGATGNLLTSNGTTWTSAALSTNWAVPGTIGSTTPNTGAFTTLTSTGNVGVGTATTTEKLTVNGNIKAGSDWMMGSRMGAGFRIELKQTAMVCAANTWCVVSAIWDRAFTATPYCFVSYHVTSAGGSIVYNAAASTGMGPTTTGCKQSFYSDSNGWSGNVQFMGVGQ